MDQALPARQDHRAHQASGETPDRAELVVNLDQLDRRDHRVTPDRRDLRDHPELRDHRARGDHRDRLDLWDRLAHRELPVSN